MLQDIDHYCKECIICQAFKSSAPQKAPLINIPIGKPWEIVTVDILQVPLSSRNNQYLLVIQDYFTKWTEAIPLPNQTANRITSELIRVFSNYGLPDILHSDQGRNFESSILCQTLEAFGIKKTRTTASTHKGMVWWNALIVHYYNYFMHMLNARQNGGNTYHLCCSHTAPQFIPQQVYHRLNLCMDGHHFPPPQHMTQYLTKASYDPNNHSYLI